MADNKSTAAGKASVVKADETEQVKDHGTDSMSGEEVANAAAETLHGDRANEEIYEQSDATVLPGGSTLIADEPQSGEKRADA